MSLTMSHLSLRLSSTDVKREGNIGFRPLTFTFKQASAATHDMGPAAEIEVQLNSID